ncbi:major facilitator superfamily domain-containing protein [Calycina marina]|uniref:Major facilitator superfamily domain-containing protein n=1 Tax=Calycina marina TaxID=1763456 RepID=A0A9P8CDN5_9HELO|nr:major facilitator superfamily domain-containing protein [Calycina marina]
MESIKGSRTSERTPLLQELAPEPIPDDVEASALTEGNPLFEGNPDTLKTLWLLFPAVSIGVLLGSADQTLVVTTYGRIGSDLGGLSGASWIATAYFLTLTSFQPLYGKLSDIFGRKPALLFAYTVFGLACLFCGLARTLPELILARAFAGIGGGGINVIVSILFSDIVPLRQRGTWQGYINIVWATGSSAGAPLGGLLADSIGWRWAFLGQAPLCLIAILVVYFVLDLPKFEDTHWKKQVCQVDFLGAISLVVAVATLLVGLDQGSNVSWSDKVTIACCCTSIPLFLIFFFVEMKIASRPFAPGRIIFNRSLLASYMTNFFGLAGHICNIFYIPLYLQVVTHLTPTDAGLRLIPSITCTVVGSLFAGRMIQATGKYYWLTFGCMSVSLIGTIVVFVSGGIFDAPWVMIGGLCLMTFGTGSMVTSTLINVIANAGPADQAIATACSYLFRSLGSVIGVSLGSTAVQQRLRVLLVSKLGGEKIPDEIVNRVRDSLDFIETLDPATRKIVVECYQKASTAAFGMSIAFVGVALISSLFMREMKLSK